jgi:predicted NUDIX family NTP pyrophosphohydrolase
MSKRKFAKKQKKQGSQTNHETGQTARKRITKSHTSYQYRTDLDVTTVKSSTHETKRPVSNMNILQRTIETTHSSQQSLKSKRSISKRSTAEEKAKAKKRAEVSK